VVDAGMGMEMEGGMSGMNDLFTADLPRSAPSLDLLDFLSDEPAPTPTPAPTPAFSTFPAPTTANPPTAFRTSFPTTVPTTFPTASTAFSTDDFDPFGAQATAHRVFAEAPSAHTSATASARTPLSADELFRLSAALSSKCCYEDAHNCLEQALLVQTMAQLTAQKALAVEDDDLETAMTLKRELVSVSKGLCDLEHTWQSRSLDRPSETLEETADVISACDRTLGAKFRARFLSQSQSQSQSTPASLRQMLIGRRCARLVLCVASTHSNYPPQWARVLDVVAGRVGVGFSTLQKFDSLGGLDQIAVRTHLKVSEFARVVVLISEVGVWVAATCLEAMVHESKAKEVFASCQRLLRLLEDRWGVGSKLSSASLEDLAVEAARWSEQAAVYCSFTLRPMSYQVAKREKGEVLVETVKLYSHATIVNNTHFMEPLIKLWMHDVSTTLPRCEEFS